MMNRPDGPHRGLCFMRQFLQLFGCAAPGAPPAGAGLAGAAHFAAAPPRWTPAFGTAAALRAQLQEMTGETPLTTLQQVEPLGPKGMAQALIIAPATGTTMAMLAAGLSATPVTLAAKSLLRGGRPVVLAPSTNDALSGSAPAIAQLLQRRNYYFVPFGQDDSYKSPAASKAISPSSPIRWKAPCAVCSCSRFCCNAGAICDISIGASSVARRALRCRRVYGPMQASAPNSRPCGWICRGGCSHPPAGLTRCSPLHPLQFPRTASVKGVPMQLITITGGQTLHGRIRPAAAKNSVLPLLAATPAVPYPSRLRAVPPLADVATSLALLVIRGCQGRTAGE